MLLGLGLSVPDFFLSRFSLFDGMPCHLCLQFLCVDSKKKTFPDLENWMDLVILDLKTVCSLLYPDLDLLAR